MEREEKKYGDYLVHTTTNDGYSYPEFEKVSKCFGINYYRIKEYNDVLNLSDKMFSEPGIVEIMVDINTPLYPKLPSGELCQNLSPKLPDELFEYFDKL